MIPKFPWVLWLGIFLLIGAGTAVDVPFVFDSSSSGVAGYSVDQLESMRASSPELSGVPIVSSPSNDEILAFPVTGGGSTPEGTTDKKVGELKDVFNARVEPDNSVVRREAVELAAMYPGDRTIDQISSIYSYLKNGADSKNGWSYVADTRGIDYFMYANETLEIGKETGCAGAGDCDDFAILMSALVESIGGTTRIIFAQNKNTGGHAYTEVYLGNLNEPNNQVEGIIDWLKQKFNTDKIYTHIDTDTKDVWLNLDWGPDEKGNAHPGGPFYLGDKHIVLCIRDRYEKTALKLSDTYVTSITYTVNQTVFDPEGVIATTNQTVFEPSQDGENTETASASATDRLGHGNYNEYLAHLKFIWSVTGIEADQIIMVLDQDGTDLFGQAKYEPQSGNPWNAEVTGSVSGDKVDLTITAQKDKELVSSKLSGTLDNKNGTINGNYTQVSLGKIVNKGSFTATEISPDTSSYTTASGTY